MRKEAGTEGLMVAVEQRVRYNIALDENLLLDALVRNKPDLAFLSSKNIVLQRKSRNVGYKNMAGRRDGPRG
uniref:hypothetical protein n=1 Tax=Candidatus Electrothrix sp. TaxID=2170559 RepID=UPI004056D34D